MANSNQQRRVKKIKVVEDDDANPHNQEQGHDFWNQVPEDLLTEIFVRLPDSRSAARTSTVCRRWHSSIRLNPRQFIERFKSHHHPPEYSLPWAAVFRPNWCSEANICHVYSDEWLFLHGKLPARSFDFLPNSSNMHIKASCNHLFLVAPTPRPVDDLYICNPITEQFVHLPSGPRLEDTLTENQRRGGRFAYALARMGPTEKNQSFKVVQLLLFYRDPYSQDEHESIVHVAVFCSLSRKWETRSFPCPGLESGWYGFHSFDNVVLVNGVLYWLGIWKKRQILVYLDLEKEECGTIGIPRPGNKTCRHRIGGSHELRLLQIDMYTTEESVHLKVWRLNNNSEWILVHDKMELARPENSSETNCSFLGAFVHPTNGDLVLYVWGIHVIEYNLVDSTYKKIAELPENNSYSFINGPEPFIMVAASDSAARLDL